jgi:hypothetical protein
VDGKRRIGIYEQRFTVLRLDEGKGEDCRGWGNDCWEGKEEDNIRICICVCIIYNIIIYIRYIIIVIYTI